MTSVPAIPSAQLDRVVAERADDKDAAASLEIALVRGDAAWSRLRDPDFLRQWDELCAKCPWATGFQSHRFANAWYTTYARQFEPLLVISAGVDGNLQGLLALALALEAAEPTRPIVAGRQQAEYHAWICDPALGDVFPWQALTAVRARFPGSALSFRYIPVGTPLKWLEWGEAARVSLLNTHHRPLMRLGDGEAIVGSLKKGANRSKWKRLEKLGGLEFRQLTEPAEFERVFDDIVRLYDFRHGAVHGSQPFCTLDGQKEFHVAMMRAPELLHVTTMTVAGRLAAAHFGVRSGRELQLGTIVHDPTLAKHSPGKLHLLALGKLLVEQGFQTFDLTPGDDRYKERFANDADQVHSLTILPTPLQRRFAAVDRKLKNASKSVLRRFNLSTAEARHRLRELKNPTTLVRRLLAQWVRQPRPAALFERIGCDEAWRCAAALVRVDALDDLLAYRPSTSLPSRQAFLSAALARLEAGERAYTFADDGALAYVAWVEAPSATEGSGAETVRITGLMICRAPGRRPVPALPIDVFIQQVCRHASARTDASLVIRSCDDAVAEAALRNGFRLRALDASKMDSREGIGQNV